MLILGGFEFLMSEVPLYSGRVEGVHGYLAVGWRVYSGTIAVSLHSSKVEGVQGYLAVWWRVYRVHLVNAPLQR